jgi:N-acetylgalactosamine-N,N'-diacetylbacillosaminyl-diphospho-undecaprenol 4-alpha-N-acetylgalactosaminyltransferase
MIIPELLTGGAQRSFSQLCVDLAIRFEVQVVVFNRHLPVAYELGVPIHSLQVRGGENLVEKVYLFFLRVKRLRKIKQSVKPQVSISFLEGANYINVLSSIGERVIISVRGTQEYDLEIRGLIGWFRKRLFIPYLYQRASHIVTVANQLQQEMVQFYNLNPGKLTTIYNYYDLNKLRQKADELLPTEFQHWLSGNILINVGRLHSQKNQEFLIRVFPKIIRQHPKAKLVIIGDGPLRDYLLKRARETGIATYSAWDDTFSDNFGIYFLGEHSNPLPFLRRCDVFLFPSLYEGFPNVLIEAMFAGLPVLAANCNYGPREILEDEDRRGYTCGELLPNTDAALPQNELVWIDEITRLMGSKDLLEAYRAGGEKRAKDFSRERGLSKWISLIENRPPHV